MGILHLVADHDNSFKCLSKGLNNVIRDVPRVTQMLGAEKQRHTKNVPPKQAPT